MAGRDPGEGSMLAAATGAYICFEDEAGQSLRPPKARTRGRRGHTPVVRVSGKGSGRVPVAGLVCLRPDSRGRLFYRMRLHRGRKGERRSMSEAGYAGLITAAHRDWLTVVRLPCDSDLNPVEGARANMKNGPGNLAARNAGQLAAVVRNRLRRIQYRPALIDGFLAQTGLNLEPEPP